MFPKKIHQTWVDFNNRGSLSSNENRWIDTWKQKNPSYEYKLWTKQENDDLVANHYSDYKVKNYGVGGYGGVQSFLKLQNNNENYY